MLNYSQMTKSRYEKLLNFYNASQVIALQQHIWNVIRLRFLDLHGQKILTSKSLRSNPETKGFDSRQKW